MGFKHKQKQKGGVKLVDISKQGFTPVRDMLTSPSAKLQHFTSSSLKGFMIQLQVDPQHSEYASQSHGATGRFSGRESGRETSFILKFVVLTRNNDTDLTQFNGLDKASESQTSFYEEAILQRDIWAKSIQGGRKQICPSVANLSMFDNTSSLNLLADLSTVPQDSKTSAVFNYFTSLIGRNPSYGVGILTMPNIVGSLTFSKYSPRFNPDAYSLAIARTVRLFIDIGVAHLDLHSGNILMFTNKDGQLDCLIIDFGRACNLIKGGCAMMNQREIDSYRALREKLYNKHDHYDEAKFMEHVINELAALDYNVNQRTFKMKKGHYQMMWKANVPEDQKQSVYKTAYDLLGINVALETTHTSSFMQQLKRENPIVNGWCVYSSPPQSAASSVSSTSGSPNQPLSPSASHRNSSHRNSSHRNSSLNKVLSRSQSPTYEQQPCNEGEWGCNILGGTKRRRKKKHGRSKKNRNA